MIEDDIRKRAYEIYVRRTQSEIWDWGKKGTSDGDWTQATLEIELEAENT